jgi:uncharacterized RDD family membrane protein YckC
MAARPLHLENRDERRQTVVMIGGALGLVALDWWIARAVFDRQSLGMALMGIEVVTLDGRRASLPRYIVRHTGVGELVKPLRRRLAPNASLRWRLAETAALWALEIAVLVARDDRRSTGDLLAGTRVVMAR